MIVDLSGCNLKVREADLILDIRRKIGKQEAETMATLTEKELSTIKDLLSSEELLVKKFKMLAEHADKTELKNEMESIARKHQGHFNELYQKLS